MKGLSDIVVKCKVGRSTYALVGRVGVTPTVNHKQRRNKSDG